MSENKRNCIGVLTGLVLAACMLFASCDCNLSVSETNSGYKISYSTVLGKALLDTVGAVSDDGSEVIFSAEEIQKVFAETGMRNVRSESVKAESLLIEAETSEKKDDFVSAAGLVKGDRKSYSLLFSRETLSAMYDGMPSMMKSYIDLFMAPSFSGEETTDDEYVDLISSVYGDVVAEEIKDSKINLTLSKLDGRKQRYTIRLLDLINIKKELVYKI